MIRDGWKFVERIKVAKRKVYNVFDKPLPRGWVLRKIAYAETGPPAGKGCYCDEHELLRPGGAERAPCPDWEWAEVDGERLVWIKEGKLFAGRIGKENITGGSQLFDFNELTFEPTEAPY